MQRTDLGASVAPEATLSSWSEVLRYLDALPAPQLRRIEGGWESSEWVFRGLPDATYCLEPTIERETLNKSTEWSALEVFITQEFKSRARLHAFAAEVPGDEDELEWLSLMRHVGVPTRLLDFTYSPFVALYFAVRGASVSKVRLWAINATEVNRHFVHAYFRARRKGGEVATRVVDLRSFSTPADDARSEGIHPLVGRALLATGITAGEMDKSGCAAIVSPRALNPRIASQQGSFLLNLAEGLTLEQSLHKMMSRCKGPWYRCVDIEIGGDLSFERRLFQMNLHEQSLFPDIQGLAAFIKQRLSLHWL